VKLALATHTPDVSPPPPVALLSGSFEQRLEKAARLGYDGVELMIARPVRLDSAVIGAQVRAAGLQVAAVSSGPVFMADGLTLLASEQKTSHVASTRLEELIAFAHELQAPLVTIGSFRGRLAWVGGKWARKHLVEILQSCAESARQLGVRLTLEPLNRYETDFIRTAAEGLDFCAEVGDEALGLLLDTFHMNIEEADPCTAIWQGMAARKLWHIHLGDSNRRAPGQGHIDFTAIINTLAELGYDGYLSAELLPLPDADAAARLTIEHMRRLGA
jgi:5-keto-L-gluconate epimerase